MMKLNSKKLRKVAKRLKEEESRTVRKFSFAAKDIKPGPHGCGTLACLAGHWLHIRERDPDVAHAIESMDEGPHIHKWKQAWAWGANLLAIDLCDSEHAPKDAFLARAETRWELTERLAFDNDDWGNEYAGEMFAHSRAWEEQWEVRQRPFDEDQPLSSIANHMLRVADRIEKASASPEGEAS